MRSHAARPELRVLDAVAAEADDDRPDLGDRKSRRTFDPNNTNIELSRTLLGVALGEGLELEDPQGAVEKIFPEGYEDPAIAAAQAQPEQEFGPDAPTGTGADGQQHGSENPYGAPGRAQPAGAMGITEAKTLGRGGKGEVVWIREARVRDLAPETKKRDVSCCSPLRRFALDRRLPAWWEHLQVSRVQVPPPPSGAV
jgi:hypothetical protein